MKRGDVYLADLDPLEVRSRLDDGLFLFSRMTA